MIENLMYEFYQLPALYEKIAREAGDNFNLFELLVSRDNEAMHSKFIGELLNPSGSHGQGYTFLKLFVDYLKIEIFDTETAKLYLEYHISSKTDTEGGRIDILIQDKNKVCIAIENKIWAGDQDAQLLRYYNFIKNNSNSRLFYLNLFGDDAQEHSTKGEKFPYQIISYAAHISDWLLLCREKAANLPLLRESISQYINLIKSLTHQTNNAKMNKEIAEGILATPDKLAAYLNLVENQNVKNAVYNQIWKDFEASLQSCKNDEEKLKLYENLPQSDSLKVFIYVQSMEKLKNLLLAFAKKKNLELTTRGNTTKDWHSLTFSNKQLKQTNLIIAFTFAKPIGQCLWFQMEYIKNDVEVKPNAVATFKESNLFEFDKYPHLFCIAKNGYPYPATNADKEIIINIEKKANFITEHTEKVLNIINNIE